MRAFFLMIGSALALACASRKPAVCDPVPADLVALAGQPVYARCEVDRVASGAAIRPGQFTPTQRCGSATIQFVVDRDGRVIPATVRIVRASDRALADAYVSGLSGARFSPAYKDSLPVAQLEEITNGYSVVTSTGRTPANVSRANAPRC